MTIISSVKNNKIKSIAIVLFSLMIFFLLFLYSNKISPVSWGLYGEVNTHNGISLKGADAVAYFTEGKYIAGNSKYFHKTDSATWYFSSESNKQLFIKSPEKFMPQYGGFCTFAVTQGVTADAQPENWTIQNEKLYVFNDKNVIDEWIKGIADGSIKTANANWATRK